MTISSQLEVSPLSVSSEQSWKTPGKGHKDNGWKDVWEGWKRKFKDRELDTFHPQKYMIKHRHSSTSWGWGWGRWEGIMGGGDGTGELVRISVELGGTRNVKQPGMVLRFLALGAG